MNCIIHDCVTYFNQYIQLSNAEKGSTHVTIVYVVLFTLKSRDVEAIVPELAFTNVQRVKQRMFNASRVPLNSNRSVECCLANTFSYNTMLVSFAPLFDYSFHTRDLFDTATKNTTKL